MRSLLVLALSTAALAAADWPQWRGAARNGVVPNSPPLIDALPAGGLKQLWEVTLPATDKKNPYYSSPMGAAGKVYFHFSPPADGQAPDAKKPILSDAILCVDVATGKEAWRKVFPVKQNAKLGAPNVPCVFGGKLYFVSNDGLVSCLDAATGTEVWTKPMGAKKGSAYSASPLIVDGKVIVSDKVVQAFDAASGDQIWEAAISTSHSSSTTWTKDGTTYVIAGGNELACITLADGKECWRLPGLKGPASPVVEGDTAVLMVEDTGLMIVALTPTGGEMIHTEAFPTNNGGHNANTPVVLDGKAYCAGKDAVYCFDIAAKKMAWTGPKTGDAKASAILADGKILFGGGKNSGVVVMNAADGKLLFKADIGLAGCTSFGLVDGKLLVNGGGKLKAYDLTR